jgi:hypothetical protein
MKLCLTWSVRLLALTLILCWAEAPAQVQAQEKQHVVPLAELNKDVAKVGEARRANEATVRQLFSSEAAQKALKSANLDYAKVENAVGQLSDADVAKLAERSKQIEDNFAAGRNFSDRDLLVIVIIGVLIIALVAALR